jgi:hypothetical protein
MAGIATHATVSPAEAAKPGFDNHNTRGADQRPATC